jgi:hypothetical protein
MNDAYYNQGTDMLNLMGDLSVEQELEKFFKGWPKNEHGDFVCSKDKPMPKWAVKEGRWEHDDVHETDYDNDYAIEYKCHSCGHIWKTEMPQ